jgi:PAS domain-containing protein
VQHGIEMILMRRLASLLTMPIVLVDPRGDLLYFNEGAAMVLGQRFEAVGPIARGEWTARFQPRDADGSPMKREELPLFIATERREPCHRRFWLRGLDGVLREIESIAFPLIGQGERMLGAVGVFWDVGAPPAVGVVPSGVSFDLASPGGDRPLELLLMRQLASYLSTTIFLLAPDGEPLFYNEPAERLLGRRFEELDVLSPDEWSALLSASDAAGQTLDVEERPLIVALRQQRPAYRHFLIRGFDQIVHEIEGLAFPLVGHEGKQVGAVGIFWEPKRA